MNTNKVYFNIRPSSRERMWDITKYANDVCDGVLQNGVTQKSSLETLENTLDKKAEKNFMPMQDGDVVSTYADVSGLINDFGYKPDTKLTDGIGEFVKWYKEFYGITL